MHDNETTAIATGGPVYSGHPNPLWARRAWTSLDGDWNLRHGGKEETIRVPFPIGSPASGVDFDDAGLFLYERDFDFAGLDAAKRYELHVGACDYEAEVRLNGESVGRHRGGYASFSFDITDQLLPRGNRLEIRVRDSRSTAQARGKQTFLRRPFYVWYAGITGLWQSVWIEETGRCFLARASARGDFRAGRVELTAKVETGGRPRGALRLEADIVTPEGVIHSFVLEEAECAAGLFRLSLPFEAIGARLWSPEDPALFAVRYRLMEGGASSDQVESYFGLRSIEAAEGELRLNGKPLFLRMALVQGYYPGGVYTPLSPDRMVGDIEALKGMGFNGARVHEKIESPYFQYLCDRLGLLTTSEMPSFYRPSRTAFRAYESELREIIARDAGHPSCIARILFNETWGVWGLYSRGSKTRKFVSDMLVLSRREDPSRPVIDNSGWEHLDTDIVDFHHYLGSAALARDVYSRLASRDEESLYGFSIAKMLAFHLPDRVSTATRTLFLERSADRPGLPWFLSEYGGFGWYSNSEPGAVIDQIETYTRDIVDSRLFCGYCLTQLYDVGREVNGLLSFDREPKVDPERMLRINLYTAARKSPKEAS